MTRMCIMCQKEVSGGQPIEDTQVIRAIRKIKSKFKFATNNTLVVCDSDLQDFEKKRKSFEKKLLFHMGGGAFLILISIVLPLLSSSSFEPISVLMISLLALFLVGLAMLSYIPPLAKNSTPPSTSKNEAAKPNKKDADKKNTKDSKILDSSKKQKKTHAKSHGKKRR